MFHNKTTKAMVAMVAKAPAMLAVVMVIMGARVAMVAKKSSKDHQNRSERLSVSKRRSSSLSSISRKKPKRRQIKLSKSVYVRRLKDKPQRPRLIAKKRIRKKMRE